MKITGLQEIALDIDRAASDEAIRLPVLTVYGKMMKRIFIKGIAADGGPIGKYDTKPIYVNPDNSPRKFPAKGKTGKTKFADGSKHKTRYFSGGYREFRRVAGRGTGKVDLRLSGNMRDSFLPDFSADPVIGFISDLEAAKAEGNETRFGKTVFAHTDAELNELVKLIQDQI